jgi:hypothetical protein
MQIHAFSGFYSDTFRETRTAGVLAVLLDANPDMTWDDVLKWAHKNGKDDWTPNIDTDDSQDDDMRLISGEVYFDERFPFPDNWVDLFTKWKQNYEIGKLPPIQTASPAIQQAFTEPVISSQPAPIPQSQSVDEWDFFQSQNPDTTLPQSAPAPAPAYTQSSTPAPATTPAINPVSYQKPEPKKEGSSNMLLIVGGIIAVYMLMKRKK